MLDISWATLAALLLFGFLAAFIDSVVGGGGLISLPALLAVGLPPAQALATNKLASSFGSFTSTLSFAKSGKIDFRAIGRLVPLSFAGSLLGAMVASHVPPSILKPLVLAVLVLVLFFTLRKKEWGEKALAARPEGGKKALFILAVFGLGFYDGFFGGGTGTFLIFTMLLAGFDFLKAAGNAKLLNFASNFAALLAFFWLGQVNVTYGLPMGLAMVAGSYAGSQFAIRKGTGYVRALFLAVTLSLILKNCADLLGWT